MIDTDKYEGHTPAPWKTGGYNVQAIQVWTVDGLDETQNWIQVPMADRLLAVDAPLILQAYNEKCEEVERLREELRITQSNFSMVRNALANQYPEIEEAIWKVIE
tara:strand:- start:2139 stop:2453 length:315 start_codon:yes stop_codon:yes gene_type:complete